jgi:hypothetical protein
MKNRFLRQVVGELLLLLIFAAGDATDESLCRKPAAGACRASLQAGGESGDADDCEELDDDGVLVVSSDAM